MAEIYKYTNLIKKNTPYAKKMKALSNKIFSEVVRETSSKSLRVVKMYSEEPIYKKDYFIKYYPRHAEIGHLMTKLREYGLFRDEHQDFKEEMIRLRSLRGKQPWYLKHKKSENKEHSYLETKKV